MINTLLDFILHSDKYISPIIQNYGFWVYIIFPLVIFAETGLVIAPFLPGDSLLFALGAFAAVGSLNIFWLFIILSAAAIVGDSANYAIGKHISSKFLEKNKVRFIKEEYIQKTQKFYEKHGVKTIVIARFIPIVRTFAPFMAGIGGMSYPRFFIYNICGGILWVSVFLFGGFYFGNLKFIKERFGSIIILIIILSFLPGIVEFFRINLKNRSKV